MLKSITFKIDEDNDIYEITINNVTYDLYDIYDSEYGELFNDLNFLIDKY